MKSNKAKIITGIGWLVILNWTNRLLGFFSIIILARILTPEDFGVMAIILLALQLTETFTDIGSEQYFIQKNNATKEDLNCAWSSNLIIKFITSLFFALLAPYIATLFSYQHLIPALLTIACLPFLNALSNGQIIQYKKDLNYKKFVLVSAVSKFSASIISITMAIILKSYWALIIGAMVGGVTYAFLSYLFIEQRTSFALTGWQQQFQFSKWVILKSLVGHIRAKFDSWFAINIQGISGLGGYNLAKDLVLLPSRELLSPMSEVFFTSIAKTRNNTYEQKQQISKSITIIYIIGFPIAFGWPLIAELFVDIVLGDNWSPYVSTISALGLLVVTFSVGNFISHIMTATGHVKQLFYYDIFTLLFALLTLLLMSSSISSLNEMANIRVFIGISIILIGALWLSYLQIISLFQFLKSALFPLVCAIVMNKLVLFLSITNYTIEINLILTIVAAAIIYTTFLFIGCKFNVLGHNESSFVLSIIKQFNKTLKTKINEWNESTTK
jgi:O-antigen/teichoic acid export membrane protein